MSNKKTNKDEKDNSAVRTLDPQNMLIMIHTILSVPYSVRPAPEGKPDDYVLSSLLRNSQPGDGIMMRIDRKNTIKSVVNDRQKHLIGAVESVVFRLGASWKMHDICNEIQSEEYPAATEHNAVLHSSNEDVMAAMAGPILRFCMESGIYMVNVRQRMGNSFLAYLDIVTANAFDAVASSKADTQSVIENSKIINENYKTMSNYVYGLKIVGE